MTLLQAIVCVFLPLFSFALIILFTRARPGLSACLSIIAVILSLANAIWLLIEHWPLEAPLVYTGRWFISDGLTVSFGFLLDPISMLMLTLVAAISSLVQVYSLGYMAGDPGFGRYYAFQSLFAGVMMALTISNALLQLYVFWELVGLSSYLLIGFWYEKFSATQAGKKAFVMTRLGDVSFFIGLLLMAVSFGTLDILTIDGPEFAGRASPALITLCALLIFGGIMGKSAQFPLLTWLPDAMEGPTPVSALLHSATMVAAGVFLMARLFPFFAHSPSAMTVILAIGTVTMLMASTMAMVDRDIKKVWAYSTISQLGFMIMGLAAGGYFAGIFHLTTHAWFKALLFLCAGIWIHKYETNDVFKMSRAGARRLKIPMICIIIAAASLSGLYPFSGFFSKEAIMGALGELDSPIWLIAGLIGAFLTPYYAFRPLFVILFPREIKSTKHDETGKGSSQGLEDQKEGALYGSMAFPLIILASITIVIGFFQDPLKGFLLGGTGIRPDTVVHQSWIVYASIGLILAGIGLAWLEFGRKGASQIGFAERIPALKSLFSERWYLDRFYRRLVDVALYGVLARLSAYNDRRVINGGIDTFCRGAVRSGRVLSYLQSGTLRYNLMLIFAVLAIIALTLFFI